MFLALRDYRIKVRLIIQDLYYLRLDVCSQLPYMCYYMYHLL